MYHFHHLPHSTEATRPSSLHKSLGVQRWKSPQHQTSCGVVHWQMCKHSPDQECKCKSETEYPAMCTWTSTIYTVWITFHYTTSLLSQGQSTPWKSHLQKHSEFETCFSNPLQNQVNKHGQQVLYQLLAAWH